MSTIKSSDEHLTLNADGSSKDIKFQANGVEKASISSSGAFTSTTIDATKLTGDLPAISGANLTGVGVAGISSSADATAITIDSSENVGFGTASPSGKVHIKDGGYRQGIVLERAGSTSDRGFIYIGDGTNSTTADEVYLDGNNTAFHFRTGGSGTTAALDITSDGKGRSLFTAASWFTAEGSGTPSFNQSHNCSSIESMGSSGYYRVHWDTNLTTSTYAIVNTSHRDSYDDQQLYNITRTGESARYVYVQDSAGGIDIADFSSIIFGD